MAGAAIAIVTVLAIGLAVAATGGSGSTAPPATTGPTLVPTSVPRPIGSAPRPPTNAAEWFEGRGSPGWVLDHLPGGYELIAAYDASNGAWGRRPGTSNGDAELTVWADRAATRDTGRWLALSWSPTLDTAAVVVGDDAVRDPRRIDGATYKALTWVDADGVRTAVVDRDGAGTGSHVITSYGFDVDTVLTIAGCVVADRAEITARGRALLDGLRRIDLDDVGGDLESVATGRVESVAMYGAASTTIAIAVSSTVAGDLELPDLVWRPWTTDGGAPRRALDLRLHHYVAGEVPLIDGRAQRHLRWHDGDRTITVSGTATPTQLLDAAASLRRAGLAEWQAMLVAPSARITLSDPTGAPPRFRRIAAGTTADGTTRWTVSISGSTRQVLIGRQAGAEGSSEVLPVPRFDFGLPVLEQLTVHGALIVIVLPDVATGSAVRITFEDGPPALLAFEPIDDVFVAAAAEVTGFGEYTAELIGPDGMVIDVLAH